MAYSLTTAANVRALLDVVATFAGANGWTVNYNNLNATNGKQIGLSSGTCFVAIGEQSISANPVAVTGGNDARIYMGLSSSFNSTDKHWSHPGSLLTTNADADRVRVNDLYGPFSEVHLFGNATYVHVLVKSSANRWQHFSFGMLDVKGVSTLKPAYAIGNYNEWWNATISLSIPTNGSIILGDHWFASTFSGNTNGNSLFRIPAGLLSASYGFSAADQFLNRAPFLYLMEIGNGVNYFPANSGNASDLSTIVDMASGPLKNAATTGGASLYPAPIIYSPLNDNTLSCWLGEIPGFRFVNVADLDPGQILTYSTENWLVAPVKQKGLLSDLGNGQPNSQSQGVAFFKD